MNAKSKLDRLSEKATRLLAQRISRRSVFARFGSMLVGVASLPLLPVARGNAAEQHSPAAASEDPLSCDYWRHCAVDGFLCGCCGGSSTQCPPGTEKSPVTWIGTCINPNDDKAYIISYNDCCGQTGCGRCFCHNNEGDTPVYSPTRSNDINWCLGTTTNAYHCSLSVVIGTAAEMQRM